MTRDAGASGLHSHRRRMGTRKIIQRFPCGAMRFTIVPYELRVVIHLPASYVSKVIFWAYCRVATIICVRFVPEIVGCASSGVTFVVCPCFISEIVGSTAQRISLIACVRFIPKVICCASSSVAAIIRPSFIAEVIRNTSCCGAVRIGAGYIFEVVFRARCLGKRCTACKQQWNTNKSYTDILHFDTPKKKVVADDNRIFRCTHCTHHRILISCRVTSDKTNRFFLILANSITALKTLRLKLVRRIQTKRFILNPRHIKPRLQHPFFQHFRHIHRRNNPKHFFIGMFRKQHPKIAHQGI